MVLVVDREQQMFIPKRVDLAEPIFDAKEITFFPSFKEKCVYNINLNKCFKMYIVYEKITFFWTSGTPLHWFAISCKYVSITVSFKYSPRRNVLISRGVICSILPLLDINCPSDWLSSISSISVKNSISSSNIAERLKTGRKNGINKPETFEFRKNDLENLCGIPVKERQNVWRRPRCATVFAKIAAKRKNLCEL